MGFGAMARTVVVQTLPADGLTRYQKVVFGSLLAWSNMRGVPERIGLLLSSERSG